VKPRNATQLTGFNPDNILAT